jgi:hypothetical protein
MCNTKNISHEINLVSSYSYQCIFYSHCTKNAMQQVRIPKYFLGIEHSKSSTIYVFEVFQIAPIQNFILVISKNVR